MPLLCHTAGANSAETYESISSFGGVKYGNLNVPYVPFFVDQQTTGVEAGVGIRPVPLVLEVQRAR